MDHQEKEQDGQPLCGGDEALVAETGTDMVVAQPQGSSSAHEKNGARAIMEF